MLVAQRSRFRIQPFRLHRPQTAEQAATAYFGCGGRRAYMAGGIDLIAAMKMGVTPDDVIYLRALPDCSSIVESEDSILIGAGVTHQELADNALVRSTHPGLSEAWSLVANNRIRLKGTLVGNLMSGNPAYDFRIAAIALAAEVQFLDTSLLPRRMPVGGLAELPAGALVTHIVVPKHPCVAFAIQLQWKPILSFALSFRREHEAIVARLAAGCAYAPSAISSIALERSETGRDIAEQLCAAMPSPISDWHASSGYRSHLLKVLVHREIERARAAGQRYEG
jgi:aerobic carbon-monoxide dehydrogenase medium subunit